MKLIINWASLASRIYQWLKLLNLNFFPFFLNGFLSSNKMFNCRPFLYNLWQRVFQRFSTGLKSGLTPGHFNTGTYIAFFKKALVYLTLCIIPFSCWKHQFSPYHQRIGMLPLGFFFVKQFSRQRKVKVNALTWVPLN